MIQHIQESCELPAIKDNLIALFEDNAACIAQIKGGYIKGNRTKHISPKFFCDTPARHPMSRKGVTNLRTINLLTYIILNNYLENINLQKISYTSTVVVFTMSYTYILSLIYVYFYIYIVSKILHLHLQN